MILRRKETELAEAQGQLRQKVCKKRVVPPTTFLVQVEQLQSSERDKQSVRQQLMHSQRWVQELRQRVSLKSLDNIPAFFVANRKNCKTSATCPF